MGITFNANYRKFAIYSGFTALIAGLAVVAGWIFNISTLTHLSVHFQPMRFNSAICFIFLGVALVTKLASPLKNVRPADNAAAVLSVVISAIAIYRNFFGEYFFFFDNEEDGIYQSSITTVTAICIFFTGLSLTFLENGRIAAFTQYLLHVVTIISFIVIVGYILQIRDLHSFSFTTSMALHSAICLFMLSLAVALLNPDLGLVSLFTGQLIGNLMARKLFTRIMLAMMLIVYLRILSYRYNLMSVELATVFFSILLLFIILLLIHHTSKTLNKVDFERREAEERFQLVVNSAPNAFVMADAEGNVILANNQAAKLFGAGENDLGSAHVSEYFPDLSYKMPVHRRPEHNYNSVLLPHPYAIRQDGTRFPAEIRYTPICTEKGTIALYSVADITLRKRSERTIREQMKELRLKNKEMESFTYIASHDLQEPLRTVANYIDLLKEDYPQQIDDEIQQHLLNMGFAVERMSMLVRSLLDYGRLGQNKVLTEVDCNLVLNNVKADLDSLIKKSGADIINGTLPTITAYSTELRMLFQNLINNAIKFRKKDVMPVIKIGYQKKDDMHEFSISDNGIGIDSRHFEKIFLMFQRLHKESDYAGYGVGLANCNKIVALHGGKLWVESVPGEGSTFIFTIPI